MWGQKKYLYLKTIDVNVLVSVWIWMKCTFFFFSFFFFFFPECVSALGDKCTIHVLKNIKNGSHGTIHTFKNYFATMF